MAEGNAEGCVVSVVGVGNNSIQCTSCQEM